MQKQNSADPKDSLSGSFLGAFGMILCSEVFILLLAGILRLWSLDLKPAHFDEGINGWFVDQMRSTGFYHYDPENYHGPFYFYVLFVFLSLLGRNLWALRLPAVLSSLGSVWIALKFENLFGKYAARIGAFAMAVSPAAVFYGRYAIHESLFVLSLMVTALGLLGLWKEGRLRDLNCTATGVTLLLLLKETAVIHLACFALAAACLLLWQRIIPSKPAQPLVSQSWKTQDLIWCSLLSVLALLFFYTGTFLNWGGAADFFRAYLKWFHTGTGDGGHVKTEYQIGKCALLNWYWIALIVRYEWPALLGILFAVRLALPSPALQRYLAIYGLGVLAAYSIVPYKTPWCIISILWPFFLLFGCAIEELWRLLRFRLTTVLLTTALLFGSLLITLRLNWRHFADPSEPYVYVQTLPEISFLTEPVLGMAKRDPRNHGMSGQILLESYYPLPWIFGDFTKIGYYGKEDMPGVLDGDFIVALSTQQKVVEGRLREPYLRRRFNLRDSMEECTVWFREGLFEPWFKGGDHGAPERVTPAPENTGKEAPKPSAKSGQ